MAVTSPNPGLRQSDEGHGTYPPAPSSAAAPTSPQDPAGAASFKHLEVVWDYRACPDCNGSGFVQLGRKRDGSVGIKPATYDMHRLDIVRCQCGGAVSRETVRERKPWRVASEVAA